MNMFEKPAQTIEGEYEAVRKQLRDLLQDSYSEEIADQITESFLYDMSGLKRSIEELRENLAQCEVKEEKEGVRMQWLEENNALASISPIEEE